MKTKGTYKSRTLRMTAQVYGEASDDLVSFYIPTRIDLTFTPVMCTPNKIFSVIPYIPWDNGVILGCISSIIGANDI